MGMFIGGLLTDTGQACRLQVAVALGDDRGWSLSSLLSLCPGTVDGVVWRVEEEEEDAEGG